MNYQTHVIELNNANLVLIKAKKGYIMCDLLNIQKAEELGQAACMVSGVKTADDALKASIKACTTKARQLGIKEGMSGEDAIKIMDK